MMVLDDLSRAQRHVHALRQHALAGPTGVRVYCQLLTTMYPAELAYVMRELGLKLQDSDDEQSVIDRIVRSILPVPESTMKASQQTAQASTDGGSKKSRKQRAADDEDATVTKSKKPKRAAREAAEDEGDESPARGGTAVGATLQKLFEKGTPGRKLANALAGGETLSSKQLGALQTAINEAADAARENEDGKTASQLSGANRIVRRMRRAAE